MEGKAVSKNTFFGWWYGEALDHLLSFVGHFYAYLFDLFSVKICLQTLFAPWKRDEIGYQNLSLQQQFQVWALNMSSRFVGFWVKLFTIFTCLILEAIFSVISMASLVVWLCYPVVLLVLLYMGFKLMLGI